MKIKNFLAVDLGATSSRTLVGTLGDGNLEQTELTRFPNPIIETNGHYYWDIYALYNEIIRQAGASVIRVLDDCASYEIIADEPVQPTSELPSHLSMHNYLLGKGSNCRAALHTHPIDLIAMTHHQPFLEKDVLTNLLWSMIPETKAFCPRGLGIIPYKLPSSFELANTTVKELEDYDVVMWEKYGACSVAENILAAFDQLGVLSKSAQIYMTAKNMGFEPDGM